MTVQSSEGKSQPLTVLWCEGTERARLSMKPLKRSHPAPPPTHTSMTTNAHTHSECGESKFGGGEKATERGSPTTHSAVCGRDGVTTSLTTNAHTHGECGEKSEVVATDE